MQQYQLTLDDAPAAKGKLDQLVKQLESDNVALHAKMEENATQTAEVSSLPESVVDEPASVLMSLT